MEHVLLFVLLISLYFVIYVPKFLVTFLFVSVITKVLNYKLEFFPDRYVFQYLQIEKTIGNGKLCDNLDLLDR